MNNYHYRRRSKSKIPLLLILALLIGGGIYIYVSDNFERVAPTIKISDKIYWNLDDPIPLTVEDNFGIKSYRVALIQGENEIVLDRQDGIEGNIRQINTELRYLKSIALSTDKKTELKIEAVDNSLWNLLAGNQVQKRVEIVIDKKRPRVNIISKSYAFRKGGSALVIFEAKDEWLNELYIKSSEGRRFEVFPFVKEGFYISLIGNDLRDENFKMFVIAADKAGNETRSFIPFYYQNRRYQNSRIKLSDKFLDGKVEELFYENNQAVGVDTENISRLEKFRFINEDLRGTNYKFIATHAKSDFSKVVDDFKIEPFLPLINSKKVGSFGDHRYYYYKGKKVSESYHMGIDFASIKHDKIKLSNDGKVVFAGYNGIYGNLPIIDHGLGLFTIYGHCSNLFVSEGMELKRGDVIAETGMSGLALGDHLHFSILVQGVEVRPEEWLDKNWIKANITGIIKDAKKIIGAI